MSNHIPAFNIPLHHFFPKDVVFTYKIPVSTNTTDSTKILCTQKGKDVKFTVYLQEENVHYVLWTITPYQINSISKIYMYIYVIQQWYSSSVSLNFHQSSGLTELTLDRTWFHTEICTVFKSKRSSQAFYTTIYCWDELYSTPDWWHFWKDSFTF